MSTNSPNRCRCRCHLMREKPPPGLSGLLRLCVSRRTHRCTELQNRASSPREVACFRSQPPRDKSQHQLFRAVVVGQHSTSTVVTMDTERFLAQPFYFLFLSIFPSRSSHKRSGVGSWRTPPTPGLASYAPTSSGNSVGGTGKNGTDPASVGLFHPAAASRQPSPGAVAQTPPCVRESDTRARGGGWGGGSVVAKSR